MVLFVLGIVGLSWYAVVPGRYGRYLATGPPGAAAGGAVATVLFTALVGAPGGPAEAQGAGLGARMRGWSQLAAL